MVNKLKLSTKIPTEHEEQCAFVEWFRLQFPSVRIASIPNGIRTSIGAAIKAKKEGLSKGYPDLHVPMWNLYIEFKREKGGRLSPEQKDWHHYLEEHCGATVIVGYGCSDAVKKVMEFVKLT